jgi:hypothetical protein
MSLTVVNTSRALGAARLHRVLRADAELVGGLIGCALLQALERLRPAVREAATEHRRVRGEDRADRGRLVLQVQEPRARHPLVELRDGEAADRATNSWHQRSITIPAAQPNSTGSS